MGKSMKRILAGLAAALLLCLLPAAVLAASPNVEAVLSQLATLQSSDIDPEWEPDIRANQAVVQNLLDLYSTCSDKEKGEFTDEQNADLAAYFEALYRLQGKNAGDVAALFEVSAASSSSSSSAASSSSSSADDSRSEAVSSAPVSSAPASASLSEADSSEAAPAPGGDASMPSLPTGGSTGDGTLISNKALGSLLIVVLLGLAALLFIFFLPALRRAGKAPQTGDDDLRARELFGENYEPLLPEEEEAPIPLSSDPAPLRPQPTFTAPVEEEEPPPAPKRGFFRRQPAPPEPPEEDIWAEPEKTAGPPPAERFTARPRFGPAQPAEEAPAENSLTGRAAAASAGAASPAQPAATEPVRRARQQPPLPDLGRNPDATNSITMRSFSNQPRTGRPPKMTFRQGDPDDLDAIDE